MNKFKRDDIVERYGDQYKILKVLPNNRYLVMCVRSKLEHTYYEDDLKFYNGNLQYNVAKIDFGTNCPRCNTPWTISGFGSSKWYDCKKCNKKAEELVFSSTFDEEDPKDNIGNTMDEYDLEYLMQNLGKFKP